MLPFLIDVTVGFGFCNIILNAHALNIPMAVEQVFSFAVNCLMVEDFPLVVPLIFKVKIDCLYMRMLISIRMMTEVANAA